MTGVEVAVAESDGAKTVAASAAVATDWAVVTQAAEAESVGKTVHQKMSRQTVVMRKRRNLDPLNEGHKGHDRLLLYQSAKSC